MPRKETIFHDLTGSHDPIFNLNNLKVVRENWGGGGEGEEGRGRGGAGGGGRGSGAGQQLVGEEGGRGRRAREGGREDGRGRVWGRSI